MSNVAFFRDLLSQERGIFVKVVEAVLDDGMEYRPDPKSRTSRQLIEHLIGHNLDMIELLDDGVIHHRQQVPFESVAAGAMQLEESFGEVLDRLDRIDEEQWQEPGAFKVGEQVIMEAPRERLAWMLFLDSVHHRGQLSTHLRPMGGKVPSMYGPSADDQGPGH
jgi:uncharacterized damage-inducible protein DinB